jgi:hypothetical protein
MKTLAAVITLALAGSAFAEEPPKNEQKPRPALNLRLDDGSSAAPRVTFGPSSATQTKEEREKGLPELGGKPTRDFDRPVSSGSSAVIPKAYDPQAPR